MNKLACRYAIIQFMPYPETGEFANAGIVLTCPKTGFFSYRLEKKKYARITGFFDGLRGSLYREAMQNFEAELARVIAGLGASSTTPELLRGVFDHLVHPREAIVRFGEARAILVESPAKALDDLFDHYVGRNFLTKEYQENVLAKRVASLVNALDLDIPFREDRVGTEDYPVVFPLVQRSDGGTVRKLIKPLFLGQDEPNKIYNHGDIWIAKVRRLKLLNALPASVLFAVKHPEDKFERRMDAASSIKNDLESLGVQVVNEDDQQSIMDFAVA